MRGCGPPVVLALACVVSGEPPEPGIVPGNRRSVSRGQRFWGGPSAPPAPSVTPFHRRGNGSLRRVLGCEPKQAASWACDPPLHPLRTWARGRRSDDSGTATPSSPEPGRSCWLWSLAANGDRWLISWPSGRSPGKIHPGLWRRQVVRTGRGGWRSCGVRDAMVSDPRHR